jgi:hypothetical protein
MEKGQTATWTSKTELICNLYQIELEELILSEKKYNIFKSNLTQVSKIPDLDSVLRKTVELYERILDEKERRIADLEYKLKI